MEATVFINTTTKVARAAASGEAPCKVTARQRAKLALRFKFFETGEDPALLSSPTFRLVIKASPTGSPFAFTSTFTAGTDSYLTEITSLDATALRTALGDLPQLEAWGEIEWTLGDVIERVAFPLPIQAAYLATDEEAPDPLEEASEVWLQERAALWYPGITGLTGGGATKLDGITTAGKASLLVTLYLASELQDWLLFTGTDAEDSAAGIVRPDDYAPTTNEQVWKRVR